MKIGALACSIRLPLPEAVVKFQEMKLTGIQLFTTPELLAYSDAKLAGVRQMCADHGLEITAVCGDIGGTRFGVTAEMEDRIGLFKKIIVEKIN